MNVTSAVWQVPLCDPIWHCEFPVAARQGWELFTFTFTSFGNALW